MNKPLVTVILPIYNVEKYLEKCIETVINQTYKNLEIVLVDDGSTDASSDICDKWATIDSRIKVIHKKNAGLGMARNTGLDNATGEYVLFIDSDDFISINAIESLLEGIKDADIIYCGHALYYDEMNIVKKPIRYNGLTFSGDDVINKILPEMIGALPKDKDDIYLPVSVWHGMYSMRPIKENKIKFPSERELISEDIVFHVDLLPNIEKITFIESCLYYYRKNNDHSLTTAYNPNRFEKEVILYNELNRRLALILSEDQYLLRLQRTFLGRTRSCIVRAIRQGANSSSDIKKICTNSTVKQVLKTYPYSKNGSALAFFNWCVKYEFINVLRVLVSLRYK